ncbi:proliferation marker protein Ki-67 [Eucyclogobius newberryi]|uniref:proliferation marker protein Ki-67 n=1 Tax=Eucyclogobius newberryi TaxID=166745 RepID=UPI003B5B96B2
MPLHGKVVVLKRSGGDGTEFPLTASCMFGRKPDCDIRIQLPQVSKEHCRIDLNENKEVILTNLSSVNPTQVNGEALQQSERLKHGDVITIIDRSFRFEYPPPPTPKKRSSVGGKVKKAAVDPHLKDGTNIDNIQRSLDKTQELESKEENQIASPFSDLYQMIKQSLDVKTPRKSSVSVLQTPSRLCTPRPQFARKGDPSPVVEAKDAPKEADSMTQVEAQAGDATPKSVKKRRSVQLAEPDATPAVIASPRRTTPQRYTVSDAVEQISGAQKSPSRRKSKETASPVSAEKQVGSPAKTDTGKTTPKSSEKRKSKKRKSEELAADLPSQRMKRKRVSFGNQLIPELFDKRLPPDSPLRKGATPRRSLSLYKPKQSLLRRASVIGLLKECESPKVKSPAKKKTPSPKKSPGAKSASPKTPPKSPKSKSPSPGKKSTTPTKASPKAKSPAQKVLTPKSPSPGKSITPKKAAPKSPKSPSPAKVATPKKASPKTPSPKSVKSTPAKSPVPSKPETPKNKPQRKLSSSTEGTPKRKSSGSVEADQTPKVRGRFSVSRISTPPPLAEDVVVESVPSVTVTPKIPLKRKSLKNSTKKTPALKSAAKVMHRKSGIRASMKVTASWADIVRFGKAKVQAVPTKSQVAKKTMKKKAVPKPQTPKRRLVDHVSTGHAASPATIVVGRAHRLKAAHTGAPPKIVTNTAVLRKNLKMDEDLTGISDMFKTPKNEKRRSTKIARSATRTPLANIDKSQVDPSVLNTPEETGEMVVSPMSVASTIKGRRYNSEAVQRLLNDDVPPMDMQSESTEQDRELKANTPRTPKQKAQIPEVLTGVKKMKTPKQTAEPVEELRGKLLKTPKQKFEQPECLSAIKLTMKTPKEKVELIEDLGEKMVETPEQKIKQQEECLTGEKQIMQTPKAKALPAEDLQEKLLKTPKREIETPECLSAVKMIMKTPEQKVEQPECISAAEELKKTPTEKCEQQECLTGVKRIMKTPKVKSEPIDDIRGKLLLTPKQTIEQKVFLTGVKRIMTTPKQKGQPVEENFGLKRLLGSPQLRGNAPVEDFEGLEELMKKPVEEQTYENAKETIEQPVADQMEVDTVIATEEVIVEQTESTSITSAEVTEMSSAVESVQEDGAAEMKPVRGRRAKAPELEVEDKPSPSEETIEAPIKTRRGKKVESSVPRQTARRRNAKISEEKLPEELEGKVQEPIVEARMATLAKESPQEQREETISTEPNPHTAVQELEQSAASEEPIVKPRRGRKMKAAEPCEVTVTAQSAEAQELNEKMPSDEQEEYATESSAKSVRGRRAKVMETVAEKEAVPAEAESVKDEAVSATVVVRGRRGKKIEAPAVTAVKPRRGKVEENTDASKVLPQEETQQVAETVPEPTNPQTCVSEPTEEMVQEKPKRGRKTKPPVRPEIISVISELPVVEAKPAQLELPMTNEKPKRGRNAKTQAEPPQPEAKCAVDEASPPAVDETVEDLKVEQPSATQKPRSGRRGLKSAAEPPQTETKITVVESEPVNETQPEQAVPAEKPKRGRRVRPADNSHTTGASQTSVQGKREHTATLEEEDQPTQIESTEPKRMRRTRKVVEPSKDVQITETAEEAPIEQVKAVPPAPKSRRGALKPKEAEGIAPETTQEVSVSSATDKPKRGRKGKEDLGAAEVDITEQTPEDDAVPVKPTRGRGRTAVPAKRACRGTVVPPKESTAQATEEVSEAVPVEPVKRGRRTAKTPACVEESTVRPCNGVEAITSKRSVKWKSDLEVIDITPLKTVRGRKTKSTQQNEADNVPRNVTNAEEKDLSEKAQPAKRARRGAKAADVAEESTKTTVDNTEAETQPKTRRGRAAKK